MKPALKYLLLIFLVSFIIYFPSLFGFYTNDDFFHLSISRAESLRDFLNFFNLAKGPEGLGVYRPLTTHVFYFLGWKLFNLNPMGLHIVSFLIFFLVIYLVYKFTLMLTKKENIGLISAFLYATSATHFGHLYYLATELHLILFFLITVICFMNFLEKKKIKFYLFSIIAFGLTFLSKENAVVLPFVFVLIYLFLRYQKRVEVSVKRLIALLIPYFLILAGYAYMRFFHYGFVTGDSYIWDFSIKRAVNTLGWYGLWSFNLPEMLVDFVGPGLHFNPNLFKYWSSQIIPILILFVVEILSILYVILKSKILNRKSLSIILFSVAWFVITLSPVLFLPLHKFTFYLTLPLFGVVLMLSYLLEKRNSLTIILFCILWVSTSILTLNLTRQTNWITQGEATARRVYDYIQNNRGNLVGKTIVFCDTKGDESLPFSPTATLKNVLSNNNFFQVFYKGEITVEYGGKSEANPILVHSRQFLGY
jgi:4-amino-4-deoxy-L-arabinose transferase-like glycosyltransferase